MALLMPERTVTERIDRIALIPEKYLCEKPPPPISLKFGTTRNCNFNCTFCFSRNERTGFAGGKSGYTMPFTDRITILEKIAEVGVKDIGLFLWGEPGMDNGLAKTIQVARKNFGFEKVFLTTNGSMMTEKKVREYIEAGLTSLKFSVFAKNGKELHDIANVKESMFEKVMDNIRTAVGINEKLGNKCELSASWIRLHPEREAEIRPVLDELEDLGVRTYGLASYNIEAGQLSKEQVDVGWTTAIGNPGRQENPHPPVPCHILFTFCAIDERGNMNVCAFDHGEDTPKFTAGNLLDANTSFMDIWHSDTYTGFRKAHLQSWENQSMQEALCTSCKNCLTPPHGTSGLLDGQLEYLPYPYQE